MQLTIDTSCDTHDDIRKIIRMLQSLVGEVRTNYESSDQIETPSYEAPSSETPNRNIFESNNEPSNAAPAMFNLFDSAPPAQTNNPAPVQSSDQLSGRELFPSQDEAQEDAQDFEPPRADAPVSEKKDDSDDDMFSFDLETY